LHVVFLNYWYEATMRSIEDLLETYTTLAQWATALHAQGVEVTLVQRFHRRASFRHRGIKIVFNPDFYGPQLRYWQIPLSLHRAVRSACLEGAPDRPPTVVHFNGLLFPLQMRALREVLPRRFSLVAQHHAERPSRGSRQQLQRWGLRAADGFFFAASGLAAPWLEDRVIRGDQPVYEIMEGSTTFRRQDRAAARAKTNLRGDPVVLWVGRLIPLKDPLCVLSGFERTLQHAPQARLYMIYGSDDLLPDVRLAISRSPSLSRSVHLLGRAPHNELESLYNSADYFVLGSHYEGSGYSLAEALACGVAPVVTDIPPFRMMTDNGRIGACWTPGDPSAFATAFAGVSRQPLQALSDRAVDFFEKRLSFPAIARRAIDAYSDLAAKRANHRP
jgi:glycosyltransferase involved in cell wall biosynthesis